MNREEAIKDLEKLRAVADSWGDTDAIALDMAIEALKTQDATEELTQDLADRLNDAYSAGYNAAKREIALSMEYERAYQRGKVDATKWIPCSERLPNSQDYTIKDSELKGYLIQTEYGNMLVAYYMKKKDGMNIITERWYTSVGIAGSRVSCDVVAWMPSPEPYKAESEE